MIIILKRQQNYAYPKVINCVNYYFFVPPEHVKWLLTVIISFEKHFFFIFFFKFFMLPIQQTHLFRHSA